MESMSPMSPPPSKGMSSSLQLSPKIGSHVVVVVKVVVEVAVVVVGVGVGVAVVVGVVVKVVDIVSVVVVDAKVIDSVDIVADVGRCYPQVILKDNTITHHHIRRRDHQGSRENTGRCWNKKWDIFRISSKIQINWSPTN